MHFNSREPGLVGSQNRTGKVEYPVVDVVWASKRNYDLIFDSVVSNISEDSENVVPHCGDLNESRDLSARSSAFPVF